MTTPRKPGDLPSIERLAQVLNYCPATGAMTWAISRPKCKQGAPAGSLRRDGFRAVSVDRCNMLASRVAWALVHGEWPKGEIGHRDGNRANDAIANLIDSDRPHHHANRTQPDRDSRALALGVRKRGNRWHARFDGQHLGTYDTPEQAARALWEFKLAHGLVYRPADLLPVSLKEAKP